MSSLKSSFAEIDLPTLGATLALVVIGILSIYSSGITAEGVLVSREYLKQILWSVSGLLLMALMVAFDYQRYKDYSFFIYVFFIIVLVYTRLFGRVVNGARAWLGIGEVGIQPSEFAKVAVILFLAQYLEASEHENPLRRLLVSFGIVLLPVGLILSQPDFGTSLVFFPILIFMIFVAGLDRRYIIFILATGFLTIFLTVLPLWEKYILPNPTRFLFVLYKAPYSYFLIAAAFLVLALSAWGYVSYKKSYYFWISYAALVVAGSLTASVLAHKALKEYQIMRLIVFMDPAIDPRGSGWNILQSITAIGSGGFFGKGYLQGTQSHYRYIPQQSTDFIFSIVAEEWGFLGGFLVFGLFFILMRRCVGLLKSVRDRYAVYVVAGIMGMLFFHFVINAGMAMGIMPITGIPLFFLSYGGSSLWAVLMAVGILLGISARRYRM
ncbi:MAG: rod shape-determining protein RodA [Spirochaetaceae bacterium]|nr:rod shape-determining protein RodA [Spirochaetaceae bacterium]